MRESKGGEREMSRMGCARVHCDLFDAEDSGWSGCYDQGRG